MPAQQDARFLTFEELLERFFDMPGAEEELIRRYNTRAGVLAVDFTSMIKRTDADGICYSLALSRAAERAMNPAIEANGGEIIKRVADTFMAVFKTAPATLRAAVEGVAALREFNRTRTGTIGDGRRNDPIEPCIGLGWGEILVIPGTDLYGEEANRAFVLGEDVADGNEVLATTRFVEVIGEPLEGVTARRAPVEREETAGFSFHVLEAG